MNITEAGRLIDETLNKVTELLTVDGIAIRAAREDEKDEVGNLTALVGSVSVKTENADNSAEVYITVAACVEENGEIDDEMLSSELKKAEATANDYKARLLSSPDKTATLLEIDNMLNTGIDAAADRKAAQDRARFYKIASIVAAGLMVASAIWLLIDMIVK